MKVMKLLQLGAWNSNLLMPYALPHFETQMDFSLSVNFTQSMKFDSTAAEY
jgi:hypothetical protein